MICFVSPLGNGIISCGSSYIKIALPFFRCSVGATDHDADDIFGYAAVGYVPVGIVIRQVIGIAKMRKAVMIHPVENCRLGRIAHIIQVVVRIGDGGQLRIIILAQKE